MPRASQAKPDPAKTHIAWTSFSTDVPQVGLTILKGTQLAGDSPVVQNHPGFFVPDGTDPSTARAAELAMYSGQRDD